MFADNCTRCGVDLSREPHTMSRFNRDWICLDCSIDERSAPGYKEAAAAESAAVKRGNLNFPGIGLSAADHAYLAAKRAERRRAA